MALMVLFLLEILLSFFKNPQRTYSVMTFVMALKISDSYLSPHTCVNVEHIFAYLLPPVTLHTKTILLKPGCAEYSRSIKGLISIIIAKRKILLT